jgi:hypothetical protein
MTLGRRVATWDEHISYWPCGVAHSESVSGIWPVARHSCILSFLTDHHPPPPVPHDTPQSPAMAPVYSSIAMPVQVIQPIEMAPLQSHTTVSCLALT